MNIGIIAEDDSDVAVVSALTLRMLAPRLVGFKKFVGGGCGKLRRKCAAWAGILVQRGCSWIVVVHDLDTHDEADLKLELASAIAPARATGSVVLIPRREIEAWLLYDPEALARTFRETANLRLPGDPESLPDPKKYLCDLIRKKYRRTYLTTVHNAKVAQHIDVSRLQGSCSFSPHHDFIEAVAAGPPRSSAKAPRRHK